MVNFGGNRQSLRDYVAGIGRPRVRMLHSPTGEFNKAQALNVGLAKAAFQTVIFLDADIAIDLEFLQAATEMNPGTFLTLARVQAAGQTRSKGGGDIADISYTIKVAFKDRTETAVLTKRLYLDAPGRSGAGIVAAKRSDLVAIGGLNGSCRGWGWEDIDLIFRLQHFQKLTRCERGRGIHHPSREEDTGESKRAREASETINFATCLTNYARGDFLGTLAEDSLIPIDDESAS